MHSGALPEERLFNRKEMTTESGGNKKKMKPPSMLNSLSLYVSG